MEINMATDGSLRNPEPANTQAIAPKVKWSAVGSTAASMALFLLAAVLDPQNEIISGLPDWATLLVGGAVTGIVSLAVGYGAKHQWRVKPGAHGGATGSTEVG
jgi:hypothetical protein